MNEINNAINGQVPMVAEIKITFYKNGQVLLHTNTPDKILLFGLIEFAKQIIASKTESKILQVPAGAIPDQILKGNGGS